MLKVHERLGMIEEVVQTLRERKPRSTEEEAIRRVLQDEKESMAKSLNVAHGSGYNEQYRRNMGIAAENSKNVVKHLEEALDYYEDRNRRGMLSSLEAALKVREKPGKTERSKSVTSLYQKYRMETDPEFHAWLKKNGHDDALRELGVRVATPKTSKRVRFTQEGSSNRPEDYER
ncbi:hypothetical protein SEA_CHEETO1_58 [Microbacterium phage Cheeto1]|nr:hypothetical protein SEA_CHEETO1_58 [Microbacterium phage Cheeto1]